MPDSDAADSLGVLEGHQEMAGGQSIALGGIEEPSWLFERIRKVNSLRRRSASKKLDDTGGSGGVQKWTQVPVHVISYQSRDFALCL